MALSLVYVRENLSGMTIRIQKNKHGAKVCLGLGVSTRLFTPGYRALTREGGPQCREHCYGHIQGWGEALYVKAGQAEHPQSVADILLPLVWVFIFVKLRNIRHHTQGYFLELEVERALEIIVEKSLEMFLTLNLPSCVLLLTFNISSFPAMGLWAPHPLSSTSSVRGRRQQAARYHCMCFASTV